MAPTRPKNRGSSPLADNKTTMVPISTPTQRSPIKQRKMGISAQQKQALVDNLQLESTIFPESHHGISTGANIDLQSRSAPEGFEHSTICRHKVYVHE